MNHRYEISNYETKEHVSIPAEKHIIVSDRHEAIVTREDFERVLADQIYRTRDNRNICKSKDIRLSGPKLGRPSAEKIKSDKKTEYQDNTDRIEVEREFSLEKRCYGLGKLVTKLEETQLTSIALSVFVANLFKIQRRILYAFFYLIEIFTEYPAELSLKMA